MVEVRYTDSTKSPLASDGRLRLISSRRIVEVLGDLAGFHGHLADGEVDDAGLVGAELGAALAELGDGGLEVEGDRAGLRVGHEALAAEHHTELADVLHHVRGGDGDVEVEPAALDLLDELVGAGEGGAGVEGFLLLLGLAEHQDLLLAAELVGKDDGVADRLALLEVEPDVDLDGLVELGEVQLLDERAGARELVFLARGRTS